MELFGHVHETQEAKWEAGREAAERFEQVPEAQIELLKWLGAFSDHLPGIEGVEYAVSVMKHFPLHEEVQRWGCFALDYLCERHPALRRRRAGELGAVEVVVSALNRFDTFNGGVRIRMYGVRALRELTDNCAANAARLEAAGGSHYLQQ